ncbi:MAG: lytic transglycosylase domain-containing protein [Succinivibrionaceae bacterium]|nr:lytic transglycosylase domain-containing protein [Succinivibrionaceae bacterium]
MRHPCACLAALALCPGLALGADPVVTVEVGEAQPLRYGAEKPIENRLDSMDVYSLSRHARRLFRGHMVTWQMVSAAGGSAQALAPGGLSAIIARAASASGLPAELISAVISVESGFIATALSGKGAQGLMQLMPATQREMGVADPYDPESNITAGSMYLARMLSECGGDLTLALAAYNAGLGKVRRHGGVPPYAETEGFVRKVLSRMGTH